MLEQRRREGEVLRLRRSLHDDFDAPLDADWHVGLVDQLDAKHVRSGHEAIEGEAAFEPSHDAHLFAVGVDMNVVACRSGDGLVSELDPLHPVETGAVRG